MSVGNSGAYASTFAPTIVLMAFSLLTCIIALFFVLLLICLNKARCKFNKKCGK